MMSKLKLTKDYLKSLIIKEEYKEFEAGGKTFISCLLWVSPTYAVVSEPTAAMYPENHDPAMGRQAAYERAFEQLWKLESYRHMVNEHRNSGNGLEARVRRLEEALLTTPAQKPASATPLNTAYVKQVNGGNPTQPFVMTPEIQQTLTRLEDQVTNATGKVIKLFIESERAVASEEIKAFAQHFTTELDVLTSSGNYDPTTFDPSAFCAQVSTPEISLQGQIINHPDVADAVPDQHIEPLASVHLDDAEQLSLGDSLITGFRVAEYREELNAAMIEMSKTISLRSGLGVQFEVTPSFDENNRAIVWDIQEINERFEELLAHENFYTTNPNTEILGFLARVFELPQENIKLTYTAA